MSYPFDAATLTAISNAQSYWNNGIYDVSTNPGGLRRGGHRVNFYNMLAAAATIGASSADAADAAAVSAASASVNATTATAAAAKLSGSSTTSVSIGSGSKSFTTQSGKFFDVGIGILVTSDTNPAVSWMRGTVIAYSGTSLTIDVPSNGYGGSGSHTDWTIRVEGKLGRDGLDGDKGWAPILAVVTDSARRVLQVIDWTGGVGTKPATGDYIGSAGLVSSIGSAVDIRGASSIGSGNVNPTGSGFADGRFALFADGTGNVIKDGGVKHAVATSGDYADLSNKPTATSLLDALSTTRGSIVFRAASAWDDLGPGTAGDLLKSGGAGADPSWGTFSSFLDLYSTTRGAVLFRGASAWTALAPGTSGYFLQAFGSGADPAWMSLSQNGQCVLAKVGSSLVLSPKDGNKLMVNGVMCTIPDGGVSLAATGLTANTFYRIYATASAGVVNALEASTTAHATSTSTGNKGVEIKNGDETRTLVGIARVITGPAWQDTAAQRFVRSYFNRTPLLCSGAFTAQRTTGATSGTEINTEIRNEFVCYADDPLWAAAAAFVFNSGSNYNYLAVSWDGASPTTFGVSFGTNGSQASDVSATLLSEGYHYATVFGSVGAGTATYGTSTSVFGTLKVKVG